MINFILYEDSKEMRERYKFVILKLMGSKNNNYKIIEIDKYNKENQTKLNNIEGYKIYLLDVEVPGKSGIDLAREIRRTGDWESQIIVITSYEKYSNFNYTSKLLVLNFISKCSDIETNLNETLKVALDIMLSGNALSFSFNNEIYRIPYNKILYIEKVLNNNNCKIITSEGEYLIRDTIQSLEKKLCIDHRFIKTHRSCIVNLHKISSVDFNNNFIFFENRSVDLIARNKKKDLKDRLQKVI